MNIKCFFIQLWNDFFYGKPVRKGRGINLRVSSYRVLYIRILPLAYGLSKAYYTMKQWNNPFVMQESTYRIFHGGWLIITCEDNIKQKEIYDKRKEEL
jgi:hypothetical protein